MRKRRVDSVAIVDGTLVPTRDHRLAAPSKNYRYSTNVQIAIDADTRLVIATGDPQPGNRNDCTVYRDSGIKDQIESAAYSVLRRVRELMGHVAVSERGDRFARRGRG
ncbi:hypothetical protein H4W32_001667 [Actinophytocola algeriensis]|uniref:Transposase IS4-like domain-containing protein n=1 Tax=Actinophytocola algeriensis TaxID=1768010 RepID=A0A7W7VHL2_9PSEU|nr:hypothetical protein [Actinophytocola algeriensis]MBE1473625.1 hypothetical protein [Actinophytocola algeriensis]